MQDNYIYGKRYTKEMFKGRQVHEALQKEAYIPLIIEPVTYADTMYKTAYENVMSLKSLKTKKLCREFRIYGSVNGYRISGVIDEMRIQDGKVVVIENKTRESPKPVNPESTRPHIVQVMLYRKMIGDIKAKRYTFENLDAAYGIRRAKLSEQFERELNALGIKDGLRTAEELYRVMFSEIESLPELSDNLELHYLDRYSGSQIANIGVKYEDNLINQDLVYAMKYWNGERNAEPVPEKEKWKCNFCKFFGKECTVWWQQ